MNNEADNKSSDSEAKVFKSSSSSNNDDDSKSKSRSRSRDEDRIGVAHKKRKSKRDSSAESSSGSRSKHYRHKRSTQMKGRQKIMYPSLNGPLFTLKQFMEMQHQSVDPEEMKVQYESYKEEHYKKQAQLFFQLHLNEHWFREKYHPEQIFHWKLEQLACSKALAHYFFQQNYEGLCLDEKQGFNYQGMMQPECEEVQKAPLFGFDANARTLYLKLVPVNVSRADILETAKQTQGFVSVSMSEPLKTQNFARYAWIGYDSEDNCKAALEYLRTCQIQDFSLNPTKSFASRKPIRITPQLASDSFERDLELCLSLIKMLDTEKEVQGLEELQRVSAGQSIQFRLDLHLLYLRRVHFYCFYCGEEYDDERMLASKCGPQHIRNSKLISREDMNENLQMIGSKNFEEKYVGAVKDRLEKGRRTMEKPEEDKVLQNMKQEFAEKKTKEEQKEARYSCKLCDKKFKGAEFVQKHIFNKHCQQMEEKFNKARFEEMMKENYFKDPNKIINQPSGQGQYNYYRGDRRKDYGDHRRRRDQEDGQNERHEKRRESYIDYDDPNNNKSGNNDRQLVSYDDLF